MNDKSVENKSVEENNQFNISGLRPLSPPEASAFWDAINLELSSSTPRDDYSFGRSVSSSSNLPTMNFFPPSNDIESFDFEHLCREEKWVASVSGKSPTPYSFKKPDEKCFIQYYAPLEPLILLPNHFTTELDLESLKNIHGEVEEYLKSRGDITYTSSGLSWSGIILHTSRHCDFRICVYRSKKIEKLYIVEAQRVEGDGFLFGTLYQDIKNLFSKSSVPSVKRVAVPVEVDSSGPSVKRVAAPVEADSSGTDDNELRRFAENTKEMMNSEDERVALNGIQFAGEICDNESMQKYIYDMNFYEDLITFICRGIGVHYKWVCLYAWKILSLLATKDTIAFNKFISENKMNGFTMRVIINDEINKIQQGSTTQYENTTSKFHILKCANLISEKLSSSMDESA